MNGKLHIYKADSISLVDIIKLIDIGRRFHITGELADGEEYNNVEEDLVNATEVQCSIEVSEEECDLLQDRPWIPSCK